jgi:hypothetical protein
MNLFRSEEHARRCPGFAAEHTAGLLTLAQLASIMGTALMRERLNGLTSPGPRATAARSSTGCAR